MMNSSNTDNPDIKDLCRALMMRKQYICCQLCDALLIDGMPHEESCVLFDVEEQAAQLLENENHHV